MQALTPSAVQFNDEAKEEEEEQEAGGSVPGTSLLPFIYSGPNPD